MSIDLYPTLLEAAGLKKPDELLLDGASLMPLLLEKKGLKRDALFWHFPAYLQQTDKAKKGPWRTTPAGAIRRGDFKLIEFFEDGLLELYDLENDVSETRNLAESMPEKARELHEALKAWREATGAPVPVKKNPRYRSPK